MDTSSVHLKIGDWVTLSYRNLYMAVESATQTGVHMCPTLSDPINSIFVLCTPKHLEKWVPDSFSQEEVYFGEVLVLMHYATQKYLAYNDQLDSQSSLHLLPALTTTSQFVIKPIFKCQTVVSRKIRNNEDIIISPAEMKNREGNTAVVVKPDNRNPNTSLVLIKKNEQTAFQFSKINLSPSALSKHPVTNIRSYQLTNVETKKHLFMEMRKKEVIGFERKINQYGSYFDIRLAESVPSDVGCLGTLQTSIQYGTNIYIHSLKEDKYLCLDQLGDLRLVDVPTNRCLFLFEAYNEECLKNGSIVRIKHQLTQNYLSLEAQNTTIQLRPDARLIDTYFLSLVKTDDVRIIVFINDTHRILVRSLEMANRAFSYRQKKHLLKILRELLQSIYKQPSTTSFLNLDNSLLVQLSITEQKVMADVGMIQILIKVCRKLVDEIRQEVEQMGNKTGVLEKDWTEEKNIMIYLMMCIAGICMNNPNNAKILVKELPFLYESLDVVTGAIQLLYYLFKENKELLLILEGTQHSMGNKEVPSIQYLICCLETINLDQLSKPKILNLLASLTLAQRYEKILSHETHLLSALKSNRLDCLTLEIKTNSHHDLLVKTFERNTFEQLEQIISMKRSYQKQIELLKAELHFLCAVCLGKNLENVKYIRSIVPEEMIERYLRGNLQPQFKQIFMRILIDIYLFAYGIEHKKISEAIIITNTNSKTQQKFNLTDGDSSLSSRLIDDRQIEMQNISYPLNKTKTHSIILEKIQNLVLERTRKAISNEIIDCSFYMYIKALRRFFKYRIVDEEQIIQFQELLREFISKFLKQCFTQIEKKKIILEILKITMEYFQLQIEQISREFIGSIKSNSSIKIKNLVEYFISFTEQKLLFNTESTQHLLGFLPTLIQESIKHQDREVYLRASKLLKTVKERKTKFVNQLRSKVILDSPWSINFYHKIEKINSELNTEIHDYFAKKMDAKESAAREQKLNHLINQLNFCFYDSSTNQAKFSYLAQNIYRQMNLFETITWFITDSQRSFKYSRNNLSLSTSAFGKNDIFSTCFEFVSMYLQENQENFKRFKAKYLDLKFVFGEPDHGQIKLLYQLIKMPVARKLMLDGLIQCTLMGFVNRISDRNKSCNLWGILTLYQLMSYLANDKEKFDKFVGRIFRDTQLMIEICSLEKRRGKQSFQYDFIWSHNSKNSNYHEDWVFYGTILIKLFLFVLENTSERTSLLIQITKFISLPNILELLSCPDLTINISTENLCGTIFKSETIMLFRTLYMRELDQKGELNQNILSSIQAIFQNITRMNNDAHGAKQFLLQSLSKKASDHEVIIQEIYSSKQIQNYLNHVFMNISVYYPFITKVLDSLILTKTEVQLESSIKNECQLLLDMIFRKCKQFVHANLKYGQFTKRPKQYRNAIIFCEEIFKRKLGFNVEQEDDENQIHQEIDEDQEQKDSKELILMNKKLQNTKKCYFSTSNTQQKRIYQYFLFLFHSSDMKKHLIKKQQQSIVQFNFTELEKLLHLTSSLISLNPEQIGLFLEYFLMYLDGNIQETLGLQIGKARKQLTSLLQKEQDDIEMKNIMVYLEISLKMMDKQINREPHEQRGKGKEYAGQLSKSFVDRIRKIIFFQQKLYTTPPNKLESKLYFFPESPLLSFQLQSTTLTIELVLKWIRNYMCLVPPNMKHNHSLQFLDVIDLLQSYTNFLKEFNSQYLSQQIHEKIQLCLEIIFHSITGLTQKNTYVNYLIESQVWNDLNLLLGLDDGWIRNLDQLNDTQENTILKVARNQLKYSSRSYINKVLKYYQETKRTFRDLIPTSYYPLLPVPSLYANIKSWTISILKQFKQFPFQFNQQLFSRIDLTIIDRNIMQAYMKHQNLFNKYDIPSVQTSLDYHEQDEWTLIASNMCLQNAVEITSLKIYIQSNSSMNSLRTQYENLRLESIMSKKIQSAFESLFNFLRDFVFLFISCFMACCKKKKTGNSKDRDEVNQEEFNQILLFFMHKIGRVQVQEQDHIYSLEYLIRPECRINKERKEGFINRLNFVSTQLKLESIMDQAAQFLLFYDSQITFHKRFNSLSAITFLSKNFQMLKYLNFAVIVAQNIILIVNSHSTEDYFVDTNPDQPFVWLQIISTSTAGLILLTYLIKDFPLLLQINDMKLKKRSQAYGNNYKNYNKLVKFFIKASMVALDPTFAYHIIYSLIVGLVFYNKLFIALLLLDIFFQIPLLKNLLLSIWRPKVELILAIVSFVLVQYFFSIFMFFNFKQQTTPYCTTLSECFGFVFVTTYKSVGGFVGYLFEKSGGQITVVNFFEVFQDAYVVLVYQIFFALILAIIIDTFSVIRNEQSVRKQYLNGCCIVCDQDKSILNSSQISFKAHIAIDHNLWNYFYYYQYVHRKPTLRRTPYQRMIYLSKNANWLPNNTSKAMQERMKND